MSYALIVRPETSGCRLEIYKLSPKGSVKGGALWSFDEVTLRNLRSTLESAGDLATGIAEVSLVDTPKKKTVYVEGHSDDLETIVRPFIA